jgi:hypothetical protein
MKISGSVSHVVMTCSDVAMDSKTECARHAATSDTLTCMVTVVIACLLVVLCSFYMFIKAIQDVQIAICWAVRGNLASKIKEFADSEPSTPRSGSVR